MLQNENRYYVGDTHCELALTSKRTQLVTSPGRMLSSSWRLGEVPRVEAW